MCCDAKVAEDDAAALGEENVCGWLLVSKRLCACQGSLTFDVAMNDALFMQVYECHQRLAHDDSNEFLFKRARFHLSKVLRGRSTRLPACCLTMVRIDPPAA